MANALILTGYGINCDYETKHAFEIAGASAERVHINDLINKSKQLKNYDILAIPGGFSYADDLGAGKVLVNKMKTYLDEDVKQFISDEKLIIGICNGFQVLIKYPLLPTLNKQTATLTWNDSGRFEDRWVHLEINESKCIWTRGISKLYLPVRHGEGKIVFKAKSDLEKLKNSGQVAAVYTGENSERNAGYPWNPNGSTEDIAGICDESGRIFGLMPHPEAHLYAFNHPRWTRGEAGGDGRQIFKNAVNYFKK